MKTLLFTGGGGAATEALMGLLSDRYVVHFADADPVRPVGIHSMRWHQIPMATREHGLRNTALVPALLELCRDLAVDVLVPGVDEELRAIALHQHGLPFPCDVLLPDFTFVSRHLDKLASMRTLAEAGIAVPHTCRHVPSKGIHSWPSFPFVLKPREGRGSRDVAVVDSIDDGMAHVTRSRRPAVDFINQELLSGQEYTVTCVADRWKRLRAVVPVRVLLKRGITIRAETDADEAIIEACRRIHAADPWAGCVNIQAIKAEDGTVRPFEINPRVSTTTCLAIAAGVDVIGLAFGDAEGDGLVPFTRGLQLHRSWRSEFRWAS